MIKIGTTKKTKFTLKAIYNNKDLNKNIVKKPNYITEFISKKEAYIYLGDKNKAIFKTIKMAIVSIITSDLRDYQIDTKSFVTATVNHELVFEIFAHVYTFLNADLYSVKTIKRKSKKDILLINGTTKTKNSFNKALIIGKSRTWTRNLQITPPNILNSVTFANIVKKEFSQYENISIKVLNKKQIKEMKMGLLLSVNLGSAYEPRVVILEYKGKPSSKDKSVLIGKGITFDAGGYNIKTGRSMGGMKYDMSGAAIAAGTMKAIAQLKPKINISVILVITDNMINSLASTPDAVFIAMDGKSVEINNTDAEGRLAMADGLIYGAKILKATRLIDIATLTGAVLPALGNTYTAVWTTTDKAWTDINEASIRAHENIWKMPFHEDYGKYIKTSDVADLKNTDLSGMAGSSSAGMFLKEFTSGKEYIHIDVAGTADINAKPMGSMVLTLTEMFINHK